MKGKKSLSLLLVLVLLATALVGCGNDDKETSNSETSEGENIDSEQYFNFVLNAEPSTLDPSKGSDIYSWKVLQNIMEPLTRLEEDENQEMELKPAGAKEWEISDDGLVWTFDLVENEWSDGEPVTANDYEFGAKRSVDPETASPFAFLMTSIKNADEIIEGDMDPDELGVKALDDNTLEITLKHPTPYFDQLTYQRVLLAQREDIVEEHGDTFGSEPDTLVYNGPFVLSQWAHNSEVVLEKNDNYWDSDS
ncbi:MAG TPA: peptide ABC transporter substrate-binding protein, partial [Tissierellaceae bacterium]|nr:peptide ABC transporter substrate-binding protein [Tissierellaceae bacterium]